MQQKTKRPVQFELTTEARTTLLTWLNRRGGSLDDFIFPSHALHAQGVFTDERGTNFLDGAAAFKGGTAAEQ